MDASSPQPISVVAAAAGLDPDSLVPYGRFVAKVPSSEVGASEAGPVVVITAITPTPL